MFSTDRRIDRQIVKVWRTAIVPAARTMSRRGVTHLADDLEGDEESWFVEVDPSTPAFTEIETDDLERALSAMWIEQGLPELAAVSHDIVRLARRLDGQGRRSAELSSDVYAMY
jgi:hypothetical protein